MHSKLPQAHKVPKVQFLCEQKGPSEGLLTAKLSQQFASKRLVRRAYLVRVSFAGDASAVSVVLAIGTKSGVGEPDLLREIGDAFASIFGAKEYLDIVFVKEEQESRIRAVCSAFYSDEG
jgi:hypothetical protein